MAKAHRSIQHWENWLRHHFLGSAILKAESEFLPHLLTDCYGKQALVIGVPSQSDLFKFNTFPRKTLLGPLVCKDKKKSYIESEFNELPISSAMIDFVLLPHSLEIIDNPRQLLTEACRIVKPEGYIVIFGFNPYSLWGLKRKLTSEEIMPWQSNFISANIVKKWLKLADFELVKHETLLFRPPLQKHDKIYRQLKWIEWIGNKLWPPLGGIYMLMAKAKTIPLTPIKLHWKQQLSTIPISLSGSSVRNWQSINVAFGVNKFCMESELHAKFTPLNASHYSGGLKSAGFI